MSSSIDAASKSLFRDALRIVNRAPVDTMKSKLRYNLKEFFQLYKDHPVEKKLLLIEQTKSDLKTWGKLMNGPPELVKNIFRGFQHQEGMDKANA